MTFSLSLIPGALAKLSPHDLGGSTGIKPILGSKPGTPIDWSSLPSLGGLGSTASFGQILNARIGISQLGAGSQPSDASQGATNANDPISQLIALVQNGTPLTMIADRLADLVTGAVRHKLPMTLRGSDGDSVRNNLSQTIANALAPPGNGPPRTATQQVAALAARLERWITAIARGTAESAGQQSDISGKILDANSARETPAQQQGSTTASSIGSAAVLVHSLLAAVAASFAPHELSAQSPHTSAPVAPTSPQLGQNVSHPTQPTQLTQPTQPASLGAPVDSSAQFVANGSTQAQSAAQAAPSPQNAPDLLARMIVRAASVDARINGQAAQDAAQPVLRSGDGTPSTPAALAARFASALNNVVAQASSSQGGFGWSDFGRNAGNSSTSTGNASNNTQAQIGIGVASNASAIAQPQGVDSGAQAHVVDPNAIIEQVIKAMSVRTTQQGTSEIRLHLTPEHLGEVSMKLTVQGSVVSASVIAQNSDVRAALVNNQQQLTRSLADAGLTLAGFSVDVSGGDAGRQQNRDRTTGFGRRYVVHELGGADDSPTPSITDLGPSLMPGMSLGLFNSFA